MIPILYLDFGKLLYLLGYISVFQNNPKDLDPSCKMDLDLWDSFETENPFYS